MGLIYAEVDIENLFVKTRVRTSALVDTGSEYLCIPSDLAEVLGFDTTEVATRYISLADGSRRRVPQVGPVRLHYGERYCDTFGFVCGDELLLGAYALEGLNVSIHPLAQKLVVNDVSPVKWFRVID